MAGTRSEVLSLGNTHKHTNSDNAIFGNDKSNSSRPSSGLLIYTTLRHTSATANTAAPISNARETVAFAISSSTSPPAHSRKANVSSGGPLRYHDTIARNSAGAALTGPRTR